MSLIWLANGLGYTVSNCHAISAHKIAREFLQRTKTFLLMVPCTIKKLDNEQWTHLTYPLHFLTNINNFNLFPSFSKHVRTYPWPPLKFFLAQTKVSWRSLLTSQYPPPPLKSPPFCWTGPLP